MSKNLGELSGRKGLEKNLFDELGKASAENGAVTSLAIEALADEFLLGKANVYGTASFYDFLRPENKGKKVYVCNGSACKNAGTQESLKEKLNAHYQAEEIGEMCCLGRCHENSAFNVGGVNGHNYSGDAIERGLPKLKQMPLWLRTTIMLGILAHKY